MMEAKEQIIDKINSMEIKAIIKSSLINLLNRLPKPIENNMIDTIIVNCKTESPKKYVAKVDKVYSATIPAKPVANKASFKIPDLYLIALHQKRNDYSPFPYYFKSLLNTLTKLPSKLTLNLLYMKMLQSKPLQH